MVSRIIAQVGEAAFVVGLSVIIILALAAVVSRAVQVVAGQLRARLNRPDVTSERRARLGTLIGTAAHTAQILLWSVATLMILQVFGINIAPVIAGAGVAGLAISLGAQTVIKDYIGGLLILLEDQFHMGDSIQVGSVTGTVERVDLRATYVRDIAGRLWVIPNGEIRILSNQTRDWARAVLDLNVGFDADAGKALAVLETAMQRAREDPAIKDLLLDAPQIQGWNSMSDWAVQVRITAKTVPGKQWDVARVLRQYALSSLQEANIRMALPPTHPGAVPAPGPQTP